MPVQARTRKQLRQSIGYNLGALKVGTATGGTNNTLIDVNTFRGGDDEYIGKLALVLMLLTVLKLHNMLMIIQLVITLFSFNKMLVSQ